MAQETVKISGFVTPQFHARLRDLSGKHAKPIGTLIVVGLELLMKQIKSDPKILETIDSDRRRRNVA